MTSSTDWQLDRVTAAWFDAPSLVAGAALVERVLGLAPRAAVDLRHRRPGQPPRRSELSR